MICKRIIVKGLVQGVGYRASTYNEAMKLGGLKGWVRNLQNGDVEIVVQGPAENVDRLLAWCYRGPSLARVQTVQANDEPIDSSLKDFEVRK